jgi:hypothetical protein
MAGEALVPLIGASLIAITVVVVAILARHIPKQK